jgi:hypothetical protein
MRNVQVLLILFQTADFNIYNFILSRVAVAVATIQKKADN